MATIDSVAQLVVYNLYLRCNTLQCSHLDETVEIQGRTPHPEIEEHDHGVR